MMCDFNKIFFDNNQKAFSHFINRIHQQQTKDKMCCACTNSIIKEGFDMDYRTLYTFCSITNKYRDYQNGNNCPYWNPKYEEKECDQNVESSKE